MNIEEVHDFCMKLKGVNETMPFGPETVVYKVLNKIFALMPLDEEPPIKINLKNTPQKNLELRINYDSIIPGYHMNKVHWNTVIVNGTLKKSFLEELITDSYNCVVNGMTKKEKETLNIL